MNMSKRNTNFLLILGSTVVSIFLLELLVRVLPENITKIDNSIVSDERIYSATRNVKFKPNYSKIWTGLGKPTIWHYNNMGYRDSSIQKVKKENVYRIVFIGDSLVMGFGVEDFEAFPKRTEFALKPKSVDPLMKHFEVINMGIQGYSTNEYKAVLEEDALMLKPDLVIVAVYPSNDLSGVVSSRDDAKHMFLMSLPDLVPYSLNQYLKEHSKLYLFTLTKYYSFIKQYELNYVFSSESNDRGWSYMSEDLLKIKSSVDEHNTKLLVIPIPHPKDVVSGKMPENQIKIIQILNKYNIRYYDPFNDLKKYKNPKELYLDDLDDHFSVMGNEYFANSIAKYLLENGIVPKQEITSK